MTTKEVLNITVEQLKAKYKADYELCNEQLTKDFEAYKDDPSNLDNRDAVRMLQGQIGVYECILEQLERLEV